MFAVPELFCLRLYSFSFLSFVNDIVWYSPRRWTFLNRKNLTTISSFSQKMFWVRIPQVTGRANSSKPSFISFVRITDDGKLLARFENKCLWKTIVRAACFFYHDLFMPFNLCNKMHEKKNELPVIGFLCLRKDFWDRHRANVTTR